MKDAEKSWWFPAFVLAVELLISATFIGKLPDPQVVTAWPNGLSTRTYPLWLAAVFVPLLNVFTLAAIALSVRFPWPLKRGDWRARGLFGPSTNAFLLATVVLHYLGLLNVSSGWTLDQGLLQSVAGVTLGILMIGLGNYQTKANRIGVWAFTPWRVMDPGAKQKCQRIAARVAMLGGSLIVLENVLLAHSKPLSSTAPVTLQMLLTIGICLGIYALVAFLTWGPSHRLARSNDGL